MLVYVWCHTLCFVRQRNPLMPSSFALEAHQLVDPRAIRVAPVVRVVHDVEADRADGQRPHQAQHEVDERRETAEQQEQVGGEPPGEHDRGLDVHSRHVACGKVIVAEICVDTLVKRFSEAALLRELEAPDGGTTNRLGRNRQLDAPYS